MSDLKRLWNFAFNHAVEKVEEKVEENKVYKELQGIMPDWEPPLEVMEGWLEDDLRQAGEDEVKLIEIEIAFIYCSAKSYARRSGRSDIYERLMKEAIGL